MIDPKFVPVPAPPAAPTPVATPRRSPVSSEQLQAWIERRQKFRRRVTAVVLAILVVVIGGFAVVWSLFHQQLLAKSRLEGLGFHVDWDINPTNLSTGGTTSVIYGGARSFYQDRITRGDLESLRGLMHLQGLALTGANWLADDDLAVIAGLGELEELELDRTPSEGWKDYGPVLLTDRVLDHVQGLSRLKILGLASNRITDAGLAKLATLKALESLDLDGTAVSDAGLDRLSAMKALKMLRLENTRVTAGGIARFQQKRPDVEVIHESAPLDLGTSLR